MSVRPSFIKHFCATVSLVPTLLKLFIMSLCEYVEGFVAGQFVAPETYMYITVIGSVTGNIGLGYTYHDYACNLMLNVHCMTRGIYKSANSFTYTCEIYHHSKMFNLVLHVELVLRLNKDRLDGELLDCSLPQTTRER